MTHSAVASRYASALADVVTTGAAGLNAETALGQLRAFEGAMNASAELTNALTSPAVPVGRKRAVVDRIAGVLNLSRVTRNFIFVLIDKRRIALLTEIIHTFETVADERMGFVRADIASAFDLNESQRALLNAKLERVSGKRVRARYSVDQSLIGGVMARIGSTVYDGSVRGQLATLGRRLSTEE
jgi:F-type H+-transporting ATPase subunit delta